MSSGSAISYVHSAIDTPLLEGNHRAEPLANHRARPPRYVRFTDEFPLTVTGKMHKFVVRETMECERGIVALDRA